MTEVPEDAPVSCQIVFRAEPRMTFKSLSQYLDDTQVLLRNLLLRIGTDVRHDTSDETYENLIGELVDYGPGVNPTKKNQQSEASLRASELWREESDTARYAVEQSIVRELHYGSPYEVIIDPLVSLFPTLGVLVWRLPTLVRMYSSMTVKLSDDKLHKSDNALKYESNAVLRGIIKEVAPLTNQVFETSSPEVARELDRRLKRTENATARITSMIDRVVTTGEGGRVDSASPPWEDRTPPSLPA